jgi:hypothetical protein
LEKSKDGRLLKEDEDIPLPEEEELLLGGHFIGWNSGLF